MPMMIIPLLSSIIGGLAMYFLVGTPIVWLTESLTTFIKGLDTSSKVLYGFIIGWLGCFDLGGPISKVPNLICDGLLLEGIKGSEGLKVLAAMVPPMGGSLSLLLSKLLKKNIYSEQEIGNIKIAFPMGLCMISEGVIPIAMNDLFRTIFVTSIGCGVTGAISFSLGVESGIPSGGVFIIPAMGYPLYAAIALAVGSFVTAIILTLIKKERIMEDSTVKADIEEDVDLSSIKFT